MKTVVLSLLIALIALPAYGGGTESFDHLLPILKNEDAYKKLKEEYVFDESIWAEIRMGSHTNFGGLRLGPYHVQARKKNETEWSTVFIFKTTYKFFDKEGNEVHFLSPNAVDYSETLTEIKEDSNQPEVSTSLRAPRFTT